LGRLSGDVSVKKLRKNAKNGTGRGSRSIGQPSEEKGAINRGGVFFVMIPQTIRIRKVPDGRQGGTRLSKMPIASKNEPLVNSFNQGWKSAEGAQFLEDS